MFHATFLPPDLGSFCRLDELGLQVVGQRLEPGRAVLACRVVETDEFARWCRRCGCEAAPRDSVTRRLAHEPLGWRPTTLLITIRRYRCTGCGHVSRQDTSRAAGPRAKLSRRALRWALEGIVCQHLTVARVAEGLGVSWNTANDAVLAEGRRVLTGFKTATSEELPDAVAVMDPFHVVRLAGDALDQCRRRVQQVTCGHRGRKGDPLYAARRTLHTGAALLTEKQQARLEALLAVSEHVEAEATRGIYQRMIPAYREPDKKHGKAMMQAVIDSVASGVPATLTEIRKLGRTLKQRATDILAFFDRPGTSNGPTEAINGRLEHLRGSALGFRNLTNYIARSLLEASGFRPLPRRTSQQGPGRAVHLHGRPGWLLR